MNCLDSGKTERITIDRFARLQPAWSPDVRTIALVTDRSESTDMEELDFGPVVIGLMDLDTEETDVISMPGASKHINPRFSPDGEYIYMVADPEGFSDIFRYSLNEQKFSRIASIATGISGLTGLSPALTVAGETGDLFFNVFYDMEYRVHSMASEEVGKVAENLDLEYDLKEDSGFTPQTAGSVTVERYLEKTDATLPRSPGFDRSDYHPSLKLVYAGMTSVGIAADRFGSSVPGGTSFLFSDMLGDYNLGLLLMHPDP